MPHIHQIVSGCVTRLAIVGVVVGVTSCAPPTRWAADYSKYPLVNPELDPAVAQIIMQEWVVTSSDVFQRGMEGLAAKTTDPTLTENLDRFSVAFVQGIRRAGWRLEPVGGAYDSWLYLQQVQGFLDGDDAKGAFASLLPDVQAQVMEIERLLESCLQEMLIDIDDAYDKAIASWVEAHPLQGLDLARVSPAAELAKATNEARDAWQSVAQLEVAVTATYARINDAILSLPQDFRKQIEIAIRGFLREPVVVNALIGLARLGDGMKETAAAVRRLDDRLDRHRDSILEDVDRQRSETLVTVAEERAIILEAVEGHREALQATIAEERAILLDAVAREREAVLSDLNAKVEVVVDGSERIALAVTDRVMVGVGRLVMLVGAGAAVVMLLVAWIVRGSRGGRATDTEGADRLSR